MTDLDLLGHPITTPAPGVHVPGVKKRRNTQPNGYAAPPGTGPAGETCKSCAFYSGVQHAKTYRKCLLMRPHWTGGPGTDIKASSPACARWRKESIPCPDCAGRGYRVDLPQTGRFGGHPPCPTCRTRGVQLPTL